MARLLIVEDHPELASLMVAAAESRGHEATAVHTGEAALALLRPAAFHAAVVDLLLPDMRGSAVLSALRDHAIPAVAVSGVFKGDRFAREATEVHGARAFFEKPFELLQLLESVEQLCGLTRPLSLPPSDSDEEEVVVFEDAALLDMDDEPVFVSPEDEPGFASSDDEPVFSPPPEEHTPVIEGLALVEEAQDPLGEEAPDQAAPEEEAEAALELEAVPEAEPEAEATPGPDEQAPAFGQGVAPVTLKTEDLEELDGLEELAADGKTPTMALSSEELQALDALAQQIEEAPAPPPSPEELKALEALEPVAEAPAPHPATEVFEALEALEPAAEAPAPAAALETSPDPEPGLALPFGEREKVWSKPAMSGPGRRPPPEWSLSGDLKNTSVPRLLNAYYEARHSGELKLKQGSVLKVVYFEAGRPVYAASNLAHERFGRFCVRRGVLPEAKQQEVAALAREQNLRTSDAMMRLGLLDTRKYPQLIEEQVKEILWSTFSWTEGAYGFSPTRPPRSGLVKLSMFPGDLILEGVLRSEPLETLRQHMPRSRRLFPAAAPPYGLHELKLKGPQALLLAYTDGSKTVADLLSITELPERGVLATLRGLELIGVLEERRDEPGTSSRNRISFGL
ncbi:response regulator [Archangium violaceum]|uniref:response regulator n=1 Tax=Archangium violaceum TaxID=83451 RepID=UPI002B2FA8D7|nr:response regulator [Archangium gephyra]